MLKTSEEIFKKLIAEHPGDPAVLNNYGLTLTECNKLSEAETALLRALDVAPDYHDARTNLAEVYVAVANFDAAAASLETALSSGSEDKNLQIKLSLIHQKRERSETTHQRMGGSIARETVERELRDVGTKLSSMTWSSSSRIRSIAREECERTRRRRQNTQ